MSDCLSSAIQSASRHFYNNIFPLRLLSIHSFSRFVYGSHFYRSNILFRLLSANPSLALRLDSYNNMYFQKTTNPYAYDHPASYNNMSDQTTTSLYACDHPAQNSISDSLLSANPSLAFRLDSYNNKYFQKTANLYAYDHLASYSNMYLQTITSPYAYDHPA